MPVSVFDLEDELEDDGESPSEPALQLPELQGSQAPRRRPNRVRQTSAGGVGLPQSLSSLRPITLPSHTAGPPSPLSPPSGVQSPRKTATSRLRNLSPEPQGLIDDDSPSQSVEFTKLVAADTPSHRGAWKKGSKAWRLFMEKQSDGTSVAGEGGIEENESISIDDWNDQYGAAFSPFFCSKPVSDETC